MDIFSLFYHAILLIRIGDPPKSVEFGHMRTQKFFKGGAKRDVSRAVTVTKENLKKSKNYHKN